MTKSEYEQFDQDSLMKEINDILTKTGASESLIMSLIPLEESNITGTLIELPSPDSMYEMMKVITRSLIIRDNKEMLAAMIDGIADAIKCEFGDFKDMTLADRITLDYIANLPNKNTPKS